MKIKKSEWNEERERLKENRVKWPMEEDKWTNWKKKKSDSECKKNTEGINNGYFP